MSLLGGMCFVAAEPTGLSPKVTPGVLRRGFFWFIGSGGCRFDSWGSVGLGLTVGLLDKKTRRTRHHTAQLGLFSAAACSLRAVRLEARKGHMSYMAMVVVFNTCHI